ncbi:hypothetical protein GCM10027275_14400 [Rhabdobacter roseus]|uniref:Putative membrane protein n=1 Tax=Rhabdobacter roseus TaxID=1655419 RepID=A0A840TUK3_9BACT|nr:glycosyltransferase family 39 protein [Rhabdobacter roseus]MBB5283359.1 putative membrane protein [Rhabdobacter roseus]
MSYFTRAGSTRSWLPLLLILLLGTALRFYRLDTYSIFFDEKSTLVVSQGIVLEGANQKDVFTKSTFTPQDFWQPKALADYYEAMTRSDIGNSPFYYLLLHGWMELFGLSDFAARAFSVLFSIGIMVVMYLFARRFFGEKPALLSAALVAIEPFFIAYSHQARNYSLTFFLALLATYFFLQIIENENDKKRNYLLYAGYILAVGLSLLSHFLAATVLLVHGLYALLYLRNVAGWVRMAVAGTLALSGLVWWMTLGGGVWTLRTLAYQADLYREMAKTRPFDNPFGIILPATLPNVFLKSLPIFSDLVLFTNGLTDALEGKKNVVVSVSVGVILALWYYTRSRWKQPEAIQRTVPAALLLLSAFFYSNHPLQFAILSISIWALLLLPQVHRRADALQRQRLWLLYLMALVPTLFLIVMSFKNGHTYGLTQRYSGFSFPYVILLLSLLILYIGSFAPRDFKVPFFLLMGIQLYFVSTRLVEFYQDRSVKYNYYAIPRRTNPYYEAAQLIKKNYQPGDTIFYPAPRIELVSEMDRTFLPYSVQDAQLTNLYLPKDAHYIQAMDTTQTDKIVMKRAGRGDSLSLVNLRGVRY